MSEFTMGYLFGIGSVVVFLAVVFAVGVFIYKTEADGELQ